MLTVVGTQAAIRTPMQRKTLAESVLAKHSAQSTRRVATAPSVALLKEYTQMSLYGSPSGGWALVSHDDDFDGLVAYSDEPIDMSNPAPEFLWLVECVDKGMLQDLHSGQRRVKSYANSVLRPVSPLLKTNWAQEYPYNVKCPMTTGGQTLSGCVATAFAQVLYHLRLPISMHGSKTYRWADQEGGHPANLSYDFGRMPIDWDNLVDEYSDHSTPEQVEAIGNFLYALGVMSEMNYCYQGGSGSLTITTTNSINTYCTGIRSQQYKGVNLKVVAEELNAGRPIVFSGGDYTYSNGHCFVIDGADERGYLHCNMGWSGGGNGYYSPSYMNGYPTGQLINVVYPVNDAEICQPAAELANKSARADYRHPATSVEDGQWYVLWNDGQSTALRDKGKGTAFTTLATLPCGQRTEFNAGLLVKAEKAGDGQYRLHTGLGNYLPVVAQNATASPAANGALYSFVSLGSDDEGTHFGIIGGNGVSLGIRNSALVGAGSGAPTRLGGNDSWILYPVTLNEAEPAVSMTDIDVKTDVVRLLKGESVTVEYSPLPANATFPSVKWTSSKPSVATVDDNGVVTGVAAGSCTLTLAATDGSGVKVSCPVMVGTKTVRNKISQLKNTAIYVLQNTGYTEGWLTAADTCASYPQLRGITTTQTGGCCDESYFAEPALGSPCTLWQVYAKDGTYYLYNVGMQMFLGNQGSEQTEYTFHPTPQPLRVEEVTSGDYVGCFYFNSGNDDLSRLAASTVTRNPAHWVYNKTAVARCFATWQLSEVTGLTDLDLLTDERLEQLEGISLIQSRSAQKSYYSLQGQRLASPARGLNIVNGHKLLVR